MNEANDPVGRPTQRHPDHGAHVDAWIPELVFGLVEGDRLAEAEEHLRQCADCAESLRTARAVYETGLALGTGHIAAEKMVAHQERAVAWSSFEAEHLGACAPCREDVALLQQVPEVDDLPWPSPSPRRKRSRPGGWRVGGALVLAAAAGVWFALTPLLDREPGRVDTRGWVEPRPLEIRVPRGSGDGDPFESAWREALGEYSAHRYESAVEALRLALAHRGDHAEAWLLLGSCHLLQGRAREAEAAFESAERLAPNEALRLETDWQEIVARLSSGSVAGEELEAIRTRLEALAATSHRRAADARELLTRFRDASPR